METDLWEPTSRGVAFVTLSSLGKGVDHGKGFPLAEVAGNSQPYPRSLHHVHLIEMGLLILNLSVWLVREL